MKRMSTAFVAVLALCLALVGCGSSASSNGTPTQSPTTETEQSSAFVGSWELVSMTQEGEETTQEDIETLKELGLCVYLDLNEDGTATLDTFGEALGGTWEEQGPDTAVMTTGDQTVDITLADGLLTLAQNKSSLTFKQIDPSEKIITSNEGASGPQYFGGETIDALDDVQNMDVAIADDDVCTIKAVATGTYVGDPAVMFEITNKTDRDITVNNTTDDWAINGAAHSATMYETIRAGETLGSIAWFNADDLAEGETLTNITGTIFVYDANDTSTELAHYEFTL